MQKKTKRNRTKYPALSPELNLKTRYELIDYDYVKTLSEDEKKWLNDFTEEYTNADFRHNHKKHKTKKLKKECYRRNNARNRDILTKYKAYGELQYIEELVKLTYDKDKIEELVIKEALEYLEKIKLPREEVVTKLEDYLAKKVELTNSTIYKILHYFKNTDDKCG